MCDDDCAQSGGGAAVCREGSLTMSRALVSWVTVVSVALAFLENCTLPSCRRWEQA